MSGLRVRGGDGVVYDIVLGEPYEVVRGWGVTTQGDLISFKRWGKNYPEFAWFLNNIQQGRLGRYARFQTVFRPCNTKSLEDMLKECLE
jgi:hypothetical protein